MALGHVETFDPEFAIRNFSDICEAMEIHPEKFCNDDGTTVPGLYIEMDNGHGTREKATQLCAMLLLYLKNLDFVWISRNAGGWPKLVPAEKVNGAISRRTNGLPILIPLVDVNSATVDELREAPDQCLNVYVSRANGATFRAGGGAVEVLKTNGCSTFLWRKEEIDQFIKVSEAEKDAFTCDAMPLYEGNPADIYRLIWKLMADPAILRVTKHTLFIKKPEQHPLFLPRKMPAHFWNWLVAFDGFPPQPWPSRLKENMPDQSTSSGRYMDILERYETARSTGNSPDEWYPLFSWITCG